MRKVYFIYLLLIFNFFLLKAGFIEFSNLIEMKSREIICLKNVSKQTLLLKIEYCTQLDPNKGLPYIIHDTDFINLNVNEKIYLESYSSNPKKLVFIYIENDSENNLIAFKKIYSSQEIDTKCVAYQYFDMCDQKDLILTCNSNHKIVRLNKIF